MSKVDPRHWGIETGYEDVRGRWHEAPAASVEAVLRAMDAAPGGPPGRGAVVVTEGREPPLDAETIVLEEGAEVPVGDGDRLPLGYHRALRRDGSEIPIIVSPGSCILSPEDPAWGWAVQVYSLRSRSSWGIGDLADLERLASWAVREGAGMMLLNPLHAVNPGPQQPSPYFPSSRRWRNPLYLAIDDVPGAADTDLTDLRARGLAASGSPTIDRDEIYAIKIEALERIWSRWSGSSAHDAFIADQGRSLLDFARYMTLFDVLPDRSSWPPALARGDPAAVHRALEGRDDRVRFHQWVQWLLAEQLDRAGAVVDLVHDLAIGVDPEGADAWMWRDLFAPDVTVGAPPDEFNARGQDWGFPPMDPWKLRASGYEPFIETIRAGFRAAAGLRVDHVMGLFRLFWIPDGAEASEGVYVRYPHEDLLNILALESHRAGAYVVGEDLGTVEDLVRDEMAARNILSYRIMWFEDDRPEQYPKRALAAATNHDLPTIAGLWTGADLQEQKDLGLEPDEAAERAVRARVRSVTGCDPDTPVDSVIYAVYDALSRAPSSLVVATLEDAAGMQRRPNLPGTTAERPNWSLPLPLLLEDLQRNARPARIARALQRRPPSHPTKGD